MDETSRCGARRALNARERSGDATSGDERRRGEARAKPVERGKSEAQVRDFGSSSVTPLDQVLEKGRSRAAGLPTYQFLGHTPPPSRCPPPAAQVGRGATVLPFVVHQNEGEELRCSRWSFTRITPTPHSAVHVRYTFLFW